MATAETKFTPGDCKCLASDVASLPCVCGKSVGQRELDARSLAHDVLVRDIPPCPDCDGFGVIQHQHPKYGIYDCPEPTIEFKCERCDGTGTWDAVLLCDGCDDELRTEPFTTTFCPNCEEATEGYWAVRELGS